MLQILNRQKLEIDRVLAKSGAKITESGLKNGAQYQNGPK